MQVGDFSSAQEKAAVDFCKVFLVGTEWYTREKTESGEEILHPIYKKVIGRQPPWNFEHVAKSIESLRKPEDFCYLFGGTEGQTSNLESDCGQPILVPVICCLVTSQSPPSTFGLQIRGEECFIPIEELGCSWKPFDLFSNTFYLHCEHVADNSKIDKMNEEEQAKFQYVSLYLEPEKIHPFGKKSEDDEDDVLTVAYAALGGGMTLEYNLKTDTILTAAKRFIEEEELDTNVHFQQVVDSLTGPVEKEMKRMADEKLRRDAMSEATKNAWSTAKFLKFYPQNDDLSLGQAAFINRYFGKAHSVFPVRAAPAFANFGFFQPLAPAEEVVAAPAEEVVTMAEEVAVPAVPSVEIPVEAPVVAAKKRAAPIKKAKKQKGEPDEETKRKRQEMTKKAAETWKRKKEEQKEKMEEEVQPRAKLARKVASPSIKYH